VTVADQEEMALSCSAHELGEGNIILEPSGRNTAPCILLSLAKLLKGGASKEDQVVIVPSDHVILNSEAFRHDLKEALALAKEKQSIVTIGIRPTFPHTGFGYIKCGESFGNHKFRVQEFREKPKFEVAVEYLKNGGYFWNAGMFVASIGTLLQEFSACAPSIYSHYAKLYAVLGDADKTSSAYFEIPKDSIDYAVMERSKRVAVLEASFDWNDLGSWDALESVITKNHENTISAADACYFENAKGNIIFAPDKFVSLINVNDLIVVCNEKSLLVIPKADSQNVKNVVEHLKKSPEGSKYL